MTTVSIRLDDRTAKHLSRRSAERGQTPEDLLREYAERLAGLEAIREVSERNAEALRKAGYTTEERVEALIREGIRESRSARPSDDPDDR